jgi:hypothetical protein
MNKNPITRIRTRMRTKKRRTRKNHWPAEISKTRRSNSNPHREHAIFDSDNRKQYLTQKNILSIGCTLAALANHAQKTNLPRTTGRTLSPPKNPLLPLKAVKSSSLTTRNNIGTHHQGLTATAHFPSTSRHSPRSAYVE